MGSGPQSEETSEKPVAAAGPWRPWGRMSPTCGVSLPHIRISDWRPGRGPDFLTSGSQTGDLAYGAGP